MLCHIADDDEHFYSGHTTAIVVTFLVVLGVVGLAIVYCTYKICSKKAMVHAQAQAEAQAGARAGAYATSNSAEGATATTVFSNGQGYTDFSRVSASGYPVNPDLAFEGGMYNPMYHHNHVYAPPPAYPGAQGATDAELPPPPESKGAP